MSLLETCEDNICSPVSATSPLAEVNACDGSQGAHGSEQCQSAEHVLSRAARILQERFTRAAPQYDLLAQECGLHEKPLRTHLRATAEACVRQRHQLEDNLLQWVATQAKASGLIPVAFLERSSYDETPLLCKVTTADGEQHVEKSKLLVAEREWSILVRLLGRHTGSGDRHDGHAHHTASSYLLLRGNECPGLRATEQTTAKGCSQSCSH